jgi:Holliday junction resolvase RusA-like endonuclease
MLEPLLNHFIRLGNPGVKNVRLVFDGIKPMSKQQGYELGYRWINGVRKMTKYQKDAYVAFKHGLGLVARAECRKQGWNGPKSCEIAVCGYFYCPRKARGHDLADNAFSGFLDAFQGIVYDDDKRIVRVHYERIFTDSMMRIELVFSEA